MRRTVQRTAGRLPGLIVGAIGVVFGDIGTSPLYTIKEAFAPHYGLTADHATVLGILSLVFWSLMIVVTVKYVDHHHARRQQRRGRHHGADGAGAAHVAEGFALGAMSSASSASSARRCSSATA